MNPPNSLALLLARFQPDPKSTQSAAVQKALFLASHLQQRVVALQTPAERRQQAELDRMLQHPEDKATLAMLTDQAFRPQSPRRVVDQFIHILKSRGIPRFFHPLQQALLKGFQVFGGLAPWIAVPAAKRQMRRQTAAVILPAEPDSLLPHLRARHAEGVRMNVNFLGEAILGEKEARRPAALEPARLAVAGGRGHLDQDLHDLFADFRPGPRPHRGHALRPPGVALPHGRASDLHPARRRHGPQVRLSRHGGIPRHGPDGRGVHADAGAAGAGEGRGRDRAASLHPRFVRLSEAALPMGAEPRVRGRGPHHLADRQGRQHGVGTLRGLAKRLAAGALQDQAGDRRQLPSHGPRGDEAGKHRRRPRRHRLAQPLRPGLRPGAGRRQRRCSTASNSRCSKAWPIRSAAPVRADAEPAALRPGLPQGELHQRHRLPHPPAGREHRAGELPPLCLPHHAGQPGVAMAGREVRRGGRGRGESVGLASADAEPPVAAAARGRRRPRMATSRERARHRLLVAAQQRLGQAPRGRLGPATGQRGGRNPPGRRGRGDPRRPDGPRVPRPVAPRRGRGPLSPGQRGGRGSGRRLRRGRPGRLANARPGRPFRPARPRGRRTPPRAGGPDRRRLGRRRKNPARVRSGSLRGHRLRRVLPGQRPLVAGDALAPRPAQGRGGRGLAVELPHRHSLRRRGRGAGRRQYRHPQARLRRRPGGLGTVPLLLARGRVAAARCNSSPAPADRKDESWSTTPASMR